MDLSFIHKFAAKEKEQDDLTEIIQKGLEMEAFLYKENYCIYVYF